MTSGWLEHAAVEWPVLPAKSVFTERRESSNREDIHLTPSQIHGVLPQSDYMQLTRTQVVQNLAGQDSMKHVEPDDFIIHLRSFQGGIEHSRHRGKVSTAYTVLTPRGDAEPRFFRWLLKSDGYIQELRTTVNQLRDGQSIKYRDFAKVALPLPPLDEQRAIADYLDRETAQIDNLIEEQRRFAALLAERRQAAIDRAYEPFTSRVQLRRHISFLTSGSRGWGDYYSDTGERFLRIGNLPRGRLDLRGEVQFVDLPSGITEGSRTSLAAGDLLFSITAFLGSVAIVDRDWAGGYVSQHVALCRLMPTMEASFAGWFCLTSEGQDQLRVGAAGGTKQQLALDDIKELRIPTATLAEQSSVIERVTRAVSGIDELAQTAMDLIVLAQERRAALITEVVTGQMVIPS